MAELADFAEMEPESGFSQTWIDAQVAAGVSCCFDVVVVVVVSVVDIVVVNAVVTFVFV